MGEDGQLLLTANLFDATGKRMGKLRRNAWVYNDDDRYSITTNPATLKLIEGENRLVFEANVHGSDQIEVPRGELYTRGGRRIEIQPTYLKVDGVTLIGNTMSGGGTFLEIGATGIGIGSGNVPPED